MFCRGVSLTILSTNYVIYSRGASGLPHGEEQGGGNRK